MFNGYPLPRKNGEVRRKILSLTSAGCIIQHICNNQLDSSFQFEYIRGDHRVKPIESESCSVVSNSWQHRRLYMDFSMKFSWNSPGEDTGVGSLFPSLNLPNPGIEPRSPSLQADSLPAEQQGKPKNTGMGSLSLLQWIFPTQELNRGLLHCRQILYQLNYQRSLLGNVI